jgi:phosphoglycolate phosphatase-like HAD superfamily hydrolase
MKDSHGSAVIFDFDGTIADSFLAVLEVVYRVAHNNKSLPREDSSRLRAMSLHQLSQTLGISWWRAFLIMGRIRRSMRGSMNEVSVVPGIAEVIKLLKTKHKLFILSSNSLTNVRDFLQRNEIETCFTGMMGNAYPFSKKHKLVEMIRRYDLFNDQIWYVGDEPQDIKAAQEASIKSVAVTWGYSNVHMLEAQQPDVLVFSPDELILLFNKQ